MRKIDKTEGAIKATGYKRWLTKLMASGEEHNRSYRYYYDDIAMNLYKCQNGVCAYTEMYICPEELYGDGNWVKGRYRLPADNTYKRVDHLGEMDHFDAANKKVTYWDWDNLFMVHAKINGIKTNSSVPDYLKPDLADYDPQKYFNYDEQTHRFVPNVDIDDEARIKEIQNAIDDVLCLNHGVIRKERSNYINELKLKMKIGEQPIIDKFFTSVAWTLKL